MKLPSLEFVRLLKPRLGFGGAEERARADQPAAAETVETRESAEIEEAQISLASLAEQLAWEANPDLPPDLPPNLPIETLSEPEEAPVEIADEPEQQSLHDQEAAPEPEPKPVPQARPAPKVRTGLLEGHKVGAIGFGRQDIAGIAAAMIEARGRVEFLPHGEVGAPGEFDLFLLNCASIEVLKREMSSFRSILASGIPAIVIGSRTALSMLRGSGDPRTWDFAAKPIHMDELIWRAVNLISRCEESEIPRKLPARVVVADNDPFTRTLIESALSRQSFACELTEDGEAAWAAIEKSQPGAVILDLTLPNRDGFQLIADIRRSPIRKPKIIVLSARQSEADILRAFALGADDYVTKPFSPLELSARLTRLVGGIPDNV
jgi:CheY-like chemotaxis protein